MLFRLFQLPGNGNKKNSTSENIYSWVHKEFKENDINATKHRLLCKLDDMSHGKHLISRRIVQVIIFSSLTSYNKLLRSYP
jgi:hypothetical protein